MVVVSYIANNFIAMIFILQYVASYYLKYCCQFIWYMQQEVRVKWQIFTSSYICHSILTKGCIYHTNKVVSYIANNFIAMIFILQYVASYYLKYCCQFIWYMQQEVRVKWQIFTSSYICHSILTKGCIYHTNKVEVFKVVFYIFYV